MISKFAYSYKQLCDSLESEVMLYLNKCMAYNRFAMSLDHFQ